VTSLGTHLVRVLERHSVQCVFGIPGVHTAELYRGLSVSSIRHVTPRHEQAAGFMADGYARVSGKPGVCFVITGPGLSNLATAMLQARADSIPMLVISSVNDTSQEFNGRLHEMPDQTAFARQIAVQSTTIDEPGQLVKAVDDAFEQFACSRPGPMHIQIPLDVMRADCTHLPRPRSPERRQAVQHEQIGIENVAQAINASDNHVIIVGGGARQAGECALMLAEKLACPVVTTINARTLFPANHPLVLNVSPSLDAVRALLADTKTVVAIGTELGATDFDMYNDSGMPAFKQLLRIDIDPQQMVQNSRPEVICVSDARRAVSALVPLVEPRTKTAAQMLNPIRKAALEALPATYRQHIDLLQRLHRLASNTLFVGDSTQLVYAGNMLLEIGNEGAWFNSSVGFGTLGYALPAAIGAKLAAPEKPVVALIGDGGMQFVLGELGTLKDLDLPVVVIVWNNNGYEEIQQFMQDQCITPVGVDLPAPDFAAIATAYGLESRTTADPDQLLRFVEDAHSQRFSLLIDFKANLLELH